MSVTAVPLRPLKKGSVAKLWIAILALALLAGGIAWAGTAAVQSNVTASGLRYRVLEPGDGASPGPRDMVLIEYEGRLEDGTVFDSSARNGGPVPMPVEGLVPGFSEALQLMQKGGRYRIWLPPELGYGARGVGPIPANATLEFDVHLVDVATEAQVRAMQQQQMMQQMMQQQMGGAAPPQPGSR